MPVRKMRPLRRADVNRRVINLGSVLVRKGVPAKKAAEIIFQRYGAHLGARDAEDVTRSHFWRGPKLGEFKGLSSTDALARRRILHVRGNRFSEKGNNVILGGEEPPKEPAKKIPPKIPRAKKMTRAVLGKMRVARALARTAEFRVKNPASLFAHTAEIMERLWRKEQLRDFFATYAPKQIQIVLFKLAKQLNEKERRVIEGEFFFKMEPSEISERYHIHLNDIPILRKQGLTTLARRIMRETPAKKITYPKNSGA